MSNLMNHIYRNGGDFCECEPYIRDCVSQMRRLEHRPDMLAGALRDMGFQDRDWEEFDNDQND